MTTFERALATWLRGIALLSRSFADTIEAPPTPPAPPSPAKRGGMLVPLYSRDQALWERLWAAASRVDVVAVVNPDSGPGTAASSFWSAVVGKSAATPA